VSIVLVIEYSNEIQEIAFREFCIKLIVYQSGFAVVVFYWPFIFVCGIEITPKDNFPFVLTLLF
jgi:hypothetical protein